MTTRFTVEFRGTPPANAKVGDRLEINGTVTIQRIGAELIDVSHLGAEGWKSYLPGEIAIDLVSNHLEVSQA
jgi:hypothetical protein